MRTFVAFALFLFAAGGALADDPPKGTTAPAAHEETAVPADSVTKHEITLGDGKLSYTATAGTLLISAGKGPNAKMFYVAYEVEGTGDKPRPVTFLVNGGPGAASAYLQIGAVGPRIVPFNDRGSAAIEPVHLIDNPDTWLAFTDLVFLDPIGTGYSPAIAGENSNYFYETDHDVESLATAIRVWLARRGRALTPLFLAGESYGGFRDALLSRRLLQNGYDLRGVVMLSPALDLSLTFGDDVSLLPLVVALPSIAASHRALSGGAADDPSLASESEQFAFGPYLIHLAAGRADEPAIDAELAKLTGLSEAEIARFGGRAGIEDYLDAYQRAHDRAISRYDGAVTAPVPRPSDNSSDDPVLDWATAVLSPAMASYVRQELRFETDAPYVLLSHEVNAAWNFSAGVRRRRYADALNALEAARAQRPNLCVMIAAGLTDLVTPYAGQRYLINQLRPIEGATPVELRVYPGGHMMYLHSAARARLTADARELYTQALP